MIWYIQVMWVFPVHLALPSSSKGTLVSKEFKVQRDLRDQQAFPDLKDSKVTFVEKCKSTLTQ